MPLQERQITILDVITDTDGAAFLVGRKGERTLFIVTITGVATVSVQGRQKNGPWRELASAAADTEVNVDNYGWWEFRAVSSGMAPGATASVVWSWT